MELFTAVERGDLVKTQSLLESESGDANTYLINSSDPSGMTPLHLASREGHLDLVKYLIDLGAEVSKPSNEGDTALHYAARNGHLGVVQCLVKKGSELETGNNTPLFVASGECQDSVVQYLVNAGADVNKASNNDALPLYIASYKGHLGIVAYLVKNGAKLDLSNINGTTPLHAASVNGHLSIVRCLVNAGACVNKSTKTGDTPLHAACRRGHTDIVTDLVNAGADVNNILNGETALRVAKRQGHTYIVEFLSTRMARKSNIPLRTHLYVASQTGHLESVESMVKAGADVNRSMEDGDTPLHAASSGGHINIVKYLMNAGAVVNKVTKDGHTPLHVASRQGHTETVECLVNAGADVNKASKNGDTPLLAALRTGNLAIVKYLITKGADPNMADSASKTPLCIASQQGHLGVVESLVIAGADVNKASKDSDTPLIAALRMGYHEIAKYLINKRADHNMADRAGQTLLYTASQKGHLGVVESLVNAGADVNKSSKDDDTPLLAAVRESHHDIAKYLITGGADPNMADRAGQTPLYIASLKGHLDIVESLVNAGADVNKATEDGDTPLLAALRTGDLGIVKYLITKGAYPNMAQSAGKTPLCIASQKGHLGVVEYLVNSGADVNKSSKDGDTPLIAALRMGHHEIAKYLITKRAHPNMPNMAVRADQTPLYIASLNGHLDIVESLMNAGAYVNKGSKDGGTPLLAALRNGNLDIVKYLFTKGADPNMADSAGRTPLYTASQKGHLSVVESLVNAGADVNKSSKDGDTPLLAALRTGDLDIVKYLITKGADTNMADSTSKTPLYIASLKGYLYIVESLVNTGADVNKGSKSGNTPLLTAAGHGHTDTVGYTFTKWAESDESNRADKTPQFTPEQNCYLEVVECLVNAGADVNKAAKDGDTPLLAALRIDDLDIVKYLITKGADPNMAENAGKTPLCIASQKGHLGVVESLVSTGADVNKASSDGDTPLIAASHNGRHDIVKYLISKRATLDFANEEGDTSFSLALKKGRFAIAEHLLIAGADVNKVPVVTRELLHAASRHGYINVVKYLIRVSSGVDVRDRLGFTPLHYAVQNGRLGVVKCLVDAGADLNIASSSGNSGLHRRNIYPFAAEGAEVERVNISDITPLHLASQVGHLSIVEYLAQAGADVNKVSSSDNSPWDTHDYFYYGRPTEPEWTERGNIKGITPLHLASYAGHLSIVEYLIQAGAAVNKASRSDNSPRDTHHFGYYGWSTEPEWTERGNIEGTTALHLASYAGHVRIVEYLAQAGADVNQASVEGITPLHAALSACLLDTSSNLRRDLRRNLKEAGLDVGMFDYVINIASAHAELPEEQYGIREPPVNSERDVEKASSTTQSQPSSNKNYLDIVTYLVTKGAEADKSNRFGVTPLHLASHAGHLGAVECLVNAGADVNKLAKHGDMLPYLQPRRRRYTMLRPVRNIYAHKTPLYIGSEEGHLNIVEYLLKSGANVNMATENGDTPLHAASNEGHFDVVQYLTTSRVNILACNKDGITPLHAASLKGNLKIVEYLVEAGANVNTVSSLGEGPLQTASRMGHHDVVHYLSVVCKNRSTPTGQEGFQPSPTHSVFDPALSDIPTHGSSTSSTLRGKHQKTKPLAEMSSNETSVLPSSAVEQEDDRSYQSRSTDKQTIAEGDDTISLEEYHIVAKIPTGEQGVKDITIQVIEKAPSELVLKEDQSIIAVGLKFSPPGLQFSSPLKVTLPHSAIFTNPRKANIVLYMRSSDFNVFSEVSPSADGTPRCVVRQDDLDLYIDHFSEWWIITYLRETFIGKRLICTPYIPLLRPKNVTHCIIMSIKDDIKGTAESIPDYKAALPGTQFLVRWRYGKLDVAYLVDDKEISHKLMEEKEFYYLNNHKMYFRLEPSDPDTLQVMVEFILSQYIKKQIMFPLLTQAVTLSPLPSHMPSVSCNPETIRRTYSSDHPVAGQLVFGKQATQNHARHPDKVGTKEPNDGEKGHQNTIRTIKKGPGARPKTRKDGGSYIQSQPGSSSILSHISSVIHSSDGELSSTSVGTLSVPQYSSLRDDGKTTSSAQNGRNSYPPQTPEIIDELDSTSTELDQMKLVDVEQTTPAPSTSLSAAAAVAGEQIGAMAAEEALPNILQMVGAGRMQDKTTNVAIYVDNRTINQPLGHGENAGNRSHIPVPSVVPVKLLHVLGVKLNKESPILQDWKGLAVELGLGEYITSLEQCKNPTEELISLAESRQMIQNLEDLAEAFQRMKRADCEELCRSYALDFERTCPLDLKRDDDSDSL